MTVLALSVLDQFYAADWIDGVQFLVHFDAPLDRARVEEAFYKTARQFRGAHGTLVALDEYRLGVDLSREVAQLSVLEVEDCAAAKQAVVPLVSRIGGPMASAYFFERADGGSSIALNLSHGLADGYGCFLFLASWAAECRGKTAHAPYCERDLMSAPKPDSLREVPRTGLLPRAGLTLEAEDVRGPRLPWQERTVSADSFAVAGSADQRISQNDLLCAHLWQELEADAEERQTHFICATDVRRNLGPAGAVYFGNATLVSKVSKTTSELREAEPITVASWIRDAVASTPGQMKEALQELAEVRSAYGLEVLPCVRTMPAHGLSVTNLSRVPFPVLDFGAGAPASAELTAEGPRRECSIVLAAGQDFRLMETRRKAS